MLTIKAIKNTADSQEKNGRWTSGGGRETARERERSVATDDRDELSKQTIGQCGRIGMIYGWEKGSTKGNGVLEGVLKPE